MVSHSLIKFQETWQFRAHGMDTRQGFFRERVAEVAEGGPPDLGRTCVSHSPDFPIQEPPSQLQRLCSETELQDSPPKRAVVRRNSNGASVSESKKRFGPDLRPDRSCL